VQLEKGLEFDDIFGVAPRNSSFSSAKETKEEMVSKMRQDLMEDVRQKLKQESEQIRLKFEENNRLLQQEFLSQQFCAEPLVAPTLRNTKGSCATPTTSKDVIGEISQCELLIESDIFSQVVTIGKVFQKATTLHNMPLSPNVVKVTVDKT